MCASNGMLLDIMAVPYERYEDEIEAQDEENSSQSEEENVPSTSAASVSQRTGTKLRYQALFADRWPKKIGFLQLVTGFFTAIIAIIQVFVLPLVNDTTGSLHVASLEKSNCYGTGLWAGLLLVITGSLGIRASVYRSVTTVYIYFTMVLLDCALFTAGVLVLLIGYSEKWTVPSKYRNDEAEFWLHLVVAALVVIGYIFVIISFTQYYEDVFCGELQLCKRSVHCCCPCMCPRAVSQEELLTADSYERPPNLPV